MLNVYCEYSKLHNVLLGPVHTFKVHPPINSTQAYYYEKDPPKLDRLIKEQEIFARTLCDLGVNVIWSEARSDCTNQINTRDVGFVIGNTFVVSKMKEKERENEHLTLSPLMRVLEENDVVLNPEQCIIEGGDIVLDGDRVFVGISQRTNEKGVEWLEAKFGDKLKVVPIYLNEGFLHLDVVFNLISKEVALVNKNGISKKSLDMIEKTFDVVYVDVSEQICLPTNVFSVDDKTVIADYRNKKTNSMIASRGKTVVELDFTEASKIGGSFRCSTCPLTRE